MCSTKIPVKEHVPGDVALHQSDAKRKRILIGTGTRKGYLNLVLHPMKTKGWTTPREVPRGGRRNVATKEQLDYISGKRYEAQKNIDKDRDRKGVFKSSAPSTDNQMMDNAPSWGKRNPTAYKQSIVEGVGHSKINANASFAEGIDAIKEVAPELADKILGEGPERIFKSDAPPVDNLPMVGRNPTLSWG